MLTSSFVIAFKYKIGSIKIILTHLRKEINVSLKNSFLVKEAHPPEWSCCTTLTQTLWTLLHVSTLFTAAKLDLLGSQR